MLDKKIFEIETGKLFMKSPSKKWVGFAGYHFFVFAVFWDFLLVFIFVVAAAAVVAVVVVFLFVCLFFLVDVSFKPHFSDIFMKIYCNLFLKKFSSL